MWQFALGFSLGVYVGTYYECKPTVDKILEKLKESVPVKK